MRLSSLLVFLSSCYFCYSSIENKYIQEATNTASIGKPGHDCLFGGICSGGAICIELQCYCVDGQRESNGVCVDFLKNDEIIRETSSPVTIGLAGRACGIGGVCRPSTKCIDGICKCSQGYNPSFGECVRDLSVPRFVPRPFVPSSRSLPRFPSV
ncbi:unnamed protein product [Caenorhabditis bovis]|uniref:EB domain-containing protein n=1 Tax=Caenorhabditis bovis TaxID=2654633 RepID=A0A8S1E981_9PELO|nr:unnamed protein product [Caenorhabditis bovis]